MKAGVILPAKITDNADVPKGRGRSPKGSYAQLSPRRLEFKGVSPGFSSLEGSVSVAAFGSRGQRSGDGSREQDAAVPRIRKEIGANAGPLFLVCQRKS